MTSQHLKFHCRSCQTLLQVPSEMAGVTGPCPHCEATITAPTLPEPQNPRATASSGTPAPVQEIPAARTKELDSRQNQNPPLWQSEQEPPQEQNRAESDENWPSPDAVKQTTSSALDSPETGQRSARQDNVMRQKKQRWSWISLIVLTFLVLLAAVVIYILHLLQILPPALYPNGSTPVSAQQADDSNPAKERIEPKNSDASLAKKNSVSSPAVAPVNLPDSEAPLSPGVPAEKNSPAPAKNPQMPVDPQDLQAEGAIPNDQLSNSENGSEQERQEKTALAKKTLTKFLRAQSLAGRLPYMQLFHRTKEDLKNSTLDGSLQKVISVRPFERTANEADGVESQFFIVAFENAEKPNYPRLMLIETMFWGNRDVPVVNAEAFLDIYDNAPRQVMEKASDETKNVYCLISPTSFCFDEVPGASDKATIQFMAHLNKKDGMAHIASAYLSSKSDLFKEITEKIKVGSVGTANLALKRNSSEDPENPYLEVIGLNSFTWH